MSASRLNKDKIAKELQTKLGKANVFQVPKLIKIVVSSGIWSLHTRKGIKDFTEVEKNIAKITWLKPTYVYSKKAVSNFKLREGMPMMLKVTLRKDKAYQFVERLTNLVLPRVRDFDGFSDKIFDRWGNFSIWFKDLTIFPELTGDDFNIPAWLQVTVVSTSSDKEENKLLAQSLWFLFKKPTNS